MRKKTHKGCFLYKNRLKKNLMIMKLTILLICVSFFQLTAKMYSQNTVIKLDKEIGSFGEVIQAIEEQSEFKVFYKNVAEL